MYARRQTDASILGIISVKFETKFHYFHNLRFLSAKLQPFYLSLRVVL